MTVEVFNKNGYVLLENLVKDVELLEDITNDFIYLPEAKNKYMKYFEDKNRRLSRMEYLLDFDERLNNIDWKKYCRSLPFNKSALALYDWAPVADELKTLDRKIVLNSMILKWDLIKDEFDKLINI